MIRIIKDKDLYKVYYNDEFTLICCVLEDFNDGNIPEFFYNGEYYKLKLDGEVKVWQ